MRSDQSRAEIKSSSEKLRKALKDLKTKIKSSRARVVPEFGRYLATSQNARIEIVESLVRLQKRITESSKVPRSLNPLRLFGVGKAKKLRKEPSKAGGRSGVNESVPLIAPSPIPLQSFSQEVPESVLRLLQQDTILQSLQDVRPIRTGMSHHASHPHESLCSPQELPHTCACNGRQVLIVDKMYLNSGPIAEKPKFSHGPTKPKPKVKRSKPVATEVVLVRRPVRPR